MGETKRILVVDDDPDITDQLSLFLKEKGYAVTTANSQAEAEELLLSCRPDAAVIDLMMEEQDSGFVLCYELKTIHPALPVIILTSVKAATGLNFVPASQEEQSWVKADSLLDKPVRMEKLESELKRLLDRAAANSGA
jgi:two-component system OmpR family response regulator